MRVRSKEHLLETINDTWRDLWSLIDEIDASQCELRTQNDGVESWSVKDIIAHLHGWHLLLLKWTKAKPDVEIEMPAEGFKWNQTAELNQLILEKWKGVAFRSVCRRLKLSHNRVVQFVSGLSETQLLNAGSFSWTKRLPISSYIAPNTTSHYKWAIKKIKRLQKKLSEI